MLRLRGGQGTRESTTFAGPEAALDPPNLIRLKPA